jgi:hypothetical protein
MVARRQKNLPTAPRTPAGFLPTHSIDSAGTTGLASAVENRNDAFIPTLDGHVRLFPGSGGQSFLHSLLLHAAANIDRLIQRFLHLFRLAAI